MRKLLAVLCMSVTIAGCATVANPITTTRLASIESSYGVALSAAVAYRDLCNRRVINRVTCTPIVKKLRLYDQQAQGAIAAANVAVKSGSALNAVSALTAAQDALTAFQTAESQYGVH